jgi:hypothetical protein
MSTRSLVAAALIAATVFPSAALAQLSQGPQHDAWTESETRGFDPGLVRDCFERPQCRKNWEEAWQLRAAEQARRHQEEARIAKIEADRIEAEQKQQAKERDPDICWVKLISFTLR